MSNGSLGGFDFIQSFITADGQAGYDSPPHYTGPAAHTAFHDAEEAAKAAFKYSQAQNPYALTEPPNSGTNQFSNPFHEYSQPPGGPYGGSQHQPSAVQQQQAFANPPAGSSLYQSDRPRNVNRRPSHSISSQHDSSSQVQSSHPSSIALQEAYRQFIQNSAYRAPTGQYQRHSPSMPSYSDAGQVSSMAHETTRLTPLARPANPLAAQRPSTSQQPHQNYMAISGHHVVPQFAQQANDQYAEIQHMEMVKNPYWVYPQPPIPASDFQRPSQPAAVQENRPTLPVQRTDTQAASPQSTSQSPNQGHAAILAQTMQRASQPAATQDHRPAPPVQTAHTQSARLQSTYQSPYQGHSTIPAQNAQNAQRQPQSHVPQSSRSSVDTGFYADRSTLDPRHLTVGAMKSPEIQPAPQSGWNPAPTGSSSQNQAHGRPSMPAVPQRTNSPTTFQPAPDHSPSVYSIPPSVAPPSQAGTESDKPEIPRQDSIRNPFSTSTAVVAQHPNRSNPTAGNKPSRFFPLPGGRNLGRLVEDTDGHMPRPKVRRLDNGQCQPMASVSSPGQHFVGPNRPGWPGKILKDRDDLIQPINANLATVKASYDPATIARDILITAGKHPTEKPLNHHLDALRRNFTRVDSGVDLATFRWDLVDVRHEPEVTKPPASVSGPAPRPVLEPAPQPTPQTVSRPVPQYTLQPTLPPQNPAPARPFNAPYPSPDTQAPYNSTRDIPRDTPPSRSPPLNQIDAWAPPSGLSSWGTLPFNPSAYYSPQRASTSTILSGLPNLDPPPPPKSSPLVFVPTPPSHSKQTTPARPDPPPTVKQKTPKSTQKTAPKTQTAKAKTPFPEVRRLPQPQVVIPPSPAKMPTKRKPGRPPRSAAHGIEVAINNHGNPVQYQVFPCQWEGCVSELHNLDAVRAHLVKVHVPHHLLCKWKGCGNTTHMAAADMFSHVANEHISKMAWELGDGPAVPETGENHK